MIFGRNFCGVFRDSYGDGKTLNWFSDDAAIGLLTRSYGFFAAYTHNLGVGASDEPSEQLPVFVYKPEEGPAAWKNWIQTLKTGDYGNEESRAECVEASVDLLHMVSDNYPSSKPLEESLSKIRIMLIGGATSEQAVLGKAWYQIPGKKAKYMRYVTELETALNKFCREKEAKQNDDRERHHGQGSS